MKKQKSAKTKSKGIPSLLLGVVINAAIYVVFTFIFTVFAYLSEDPLGLIKIFSLAALLMTGAVGGFAVGRRSEGSYTALLCALAYALIMLLLGSAVSGSAPGIGNLINYAIYIALSAVFSRFGSKEKRKSKFKHR